MVSGRAPGVNTRMAHASLPGSRAGPQGRHHAGRAPASSCRCRRRPRTASEPAVLQQLSTSAASVVLATEEELGVVLVEAGAGRGRARPSRRRRRRRRDRGAGRAGDGRDQVLERVGVGGAGAQVDPGAGAQEGQPRVGHLRRAREQDEEEPELGVLGRPVVGHGQLLARPVPEPRRADHDGTGRGPGEAVDDLLLPGPAGGEDPLVQPRLDAAPPEMLGDAVHGLGVGAVVRDEDVVPLTHLLLHCPAVWPRRSGAAGRPDR